MDLSSQKKNRIFYLDIARVFAILSISCNHAVNRAYENYVGQQREFLSFSLASNFLKAAVSVFSRLGVPIFLMITGVLMLGKNMEDRQTLQRHYKHNFLSLLLTTEIWYGIFYWVILLLDPHDTVLENQGLGGAFLGMLDTMLFRNQITMGSMWYMPMILCLYLTMPIYCVALKRLPKWVLAIPLAITIYNSFLIPGHSDYLLLTGGEAINRTLRESNLISMFYVYLFAGYFLGQGRLKRLPTWLVGVLGLGIFSGAVVYQVFAYSCELNHLVAYESVLVLTCSIFVFELLRRAEPAFRWCRKAITGLSRQAFAVYFVHILIMSLMDWYMVPPFRPSLWMVTLEAVSIGGSLILINLLKYIPFCRKYLFMIK